MREPQKLFPNQNRKLICGTSARDIKFKHLHYNPSYLHGIEEAQPLFLALLEALQMYQRQFCCCPIVSSES